MKTNLWLLFVLIFLFTASYFTEEWSYHKKKLQLDAKERLYDASAFGELQGFETPVAKILKGNNDYYTSKHYKLADKSLVEFVFNVLSGVKAKRFIAVDELSQKSYRDFIPDEKLKFSLLFKNGILTYVVGKKLDFDRSFYMEIRNSITREKGVVIAYDVTSDEGVHDKDEFHRSAEKYNRLKALLILPEEYFYDRSVFKKISFDSIKADWKYLDVNNMRNRPFKILLDSYATIPNVISGVSYNREAFENYLRKLIAIKARYLKLDSKQNDLDGHLSTIVITKNNNKNVSLDLYGYHDGVQGYFLKTSMGEDIFELDPDDAKIFFTNHQVFWMKTPVAEQEFNTFEIPFELEIQNEKFQMIGYFGNKNQFKMVDNIKLDPKQSVFQNIFKILKKSGDDASVFNHSADENNYVENALFSLLLMGSKYYFYKDESDLIVINATKSYKIKFFGFKDELPLNAASLFYAKE